MQSLRRSNYNRLHPCRLAVAAFLAVSALPAFAATAIDVRFAPNPVAPGTTSTLTFTFLNSDAAAVTVNPGTPTSFNLPSSPAPGLVFASAAAVDSGCGFTGSGAADGGTALTIGTNGTVPANGQCSVSFTVRTPGIGGQNYDLPIPAGAFAVSDGSHPPDVAGTATLTTSNFSPVTITATSPAHAIANSGGGSIFSDAPANRAVTFTLTNPNAAALTGVGIVVPKNGGFAVAFGTGSNPAGDPEILSTTCGGTVGVDPASKMPVLSGGTIPAGGSCTVSASLRFDDDAFFTGNVSGGFILANTLTSDQGATNAQGDWSALWTRGIGYGKTFDKSAIGINGVVTMTLPVQSFESFPVNYDIPDAIPDGFHVTAISGAAGSASGDAADVCDPPAISLPAVGTIHFTGTLGAAIPPGSVSGFTSCTYTVTLVADNVSFGATPPSNSVQTLTNTLAAGNNVPGTPTSPAVSFTPAGSNPGVAIYGNAYAPSASTTVYNCPDGDPGCNAFQIATTQTFTSIDNTTGALRVTNEGGVGQIAWGGDGYFTISLTNPDIAPITGLTVNDAFTDTTQVSIAVPTTYLAAASTTCGGVLTATPGQKAFTLAGGNLAAGASCTITIPVHAARTSFISNPLITNALNPGSIYGANANAPGGTIVNAFSKISVNSGANVTLDNRVSATNDTIVAGGSTQLTLTLAKQPGVGPISNGSLVYGLDPSTLSPTQATSFVATGIASSTCGAVTVTDDGTGVPIGTTPASVLAIRGIVLPGGTPAALAGYSVAGQPIDPAAYQSAGQTCQIVLDIQQTNAQTGAYLTSGFFLSFSNSPLVGDASFSGGGQTLQAINLVDPSPMAVTKSFAPAPAAAGQTVTLTIDLPNTTGQIVDLTGVSFVDNYPAGLVNAAVPNPVLTCTGASGGGTLTAVPNGSGISWSGGTLAAGDDCEIRVDVLPLASGLTNRLLDTSLSNEQGVVATPFSALLGTTASIGVAKRFTPSAIWSNQTSTLRLSIVNFYASDATIDHLVDDLAAMTGVTASGPLVDASGCGITGTVTPSQITLTGGLVPAGGSCDVEVTVTGTTPGVYTNTIPSGALTATIANGGGPAANSGTASAELAVHAPLTITKTVTSSDGQVTGVSNTFTFTVGGCSLAANAAGATGTITLAGALSGSVAIDGILPDTCTVTETAPTAPPQNYAWDATPPAQTVTTTLDGPNALAFTNALTRQTTSIPLSKTVSVSPANPVPAIGGTITFTANCTASGDGSYSGVVVLGGTSGTGAIAGVPQGASCTVTEDTTTLPAVTSYTWSTAPTPAAVTLIADGSASAAFTNTLTANPAGLTVNKTITGAPASAITGPLTFPFSVACSTPAATYTGSVTVAAGTLTGASSAIDIPAGSTSCVVTEGTRPGAPSHYTWSGPTYTQPDPAALAAGGRIGATIVNPLDADPAELVVTKNITGVQASAITQALTFPFNVTCQTPSATYAGAVTVAAGQLSGNNGAGPVSIPAGSTACVVTEGTLPSAPQNYAWGTPVYTQPAPAAAAAGGRLAATIGNVLERQTGELVVRKTVSGGPGAGIRATFGFTADCGDAGRFTADVVLAGAATGSAAIPDVPAGATCSVAETDIPAAPASYRWGATPAAVTLMTTAAGPNTAEFTNVLTAIAPVFTLTKTVNGGPATGVSGTFTFAIDCGAAGTFTRSVTLADAASANVSIDEIPAGATCTFSESPSLPPAPAGFEWAALPSAQTRVIDGSGVIFANTLNAASSAPAEPVPATSRWALLILGVLAIVAGGRFTYQRRK